LVPIADTAWTPSFDSSMMSPEMAMGGAGGFDGQMGDIVGALADAGRFDLIPPVMEAAGFDMSGPDPLAPLAQSPSEAMPSMPEAEALPVPSLMSLMTQAPEAPAFMAPWNPMGDLGQSTFNPSPLPQQPLVINPEQQYGAQSFDESGFTGPSYPVETHNLTWDQAEGLHKLGLLNGGWRGAPDLGIEAANSYEWGSQYAQPRENIPTSEYAPGGRADQVADQVTRALQGQSGAQSFDESGFSLPPLQHNDGGPFGTQGATDVSQPDFNWVFGGQPETPPVAPSSIINDHFKGYEPTPQPDSFNDRFGAAYPATSFNDRFGSWPEQQQAAPLQHNDGGPPGSSSMAGMSDGPPATFGQPQAQVPLPQPRPADLGQPLTWQETVDKFNAGAKLETPGKGLSSNPNDATPPSTAGVPKDIVGRAEQLVKLGGSSAQLQKFMASQGYPKNSAWCGDFAASVLKSQGYTPPKGAPVASNWRNFGTEVQTPQPGDIAVRNTNLRGQPVPTGQTGSHVTMVKEYNADTGRFAGVGGNQTRPVSNYAADNFRFFRPDTQVASAQNQAPATLAMEANKDFSPNKPIPGDQATKLAGKPPLEETTTPPTATQTARVADAGQRTMTDMPQDGGGFPSLFSSLFGGGQQQGGMPAIMGGGGGRNPFNDPGSLAAMELIVNSLSRAAPISGLADSAIQSQRYAEHQMSRQAMEEALVASNVPRQQARALSYNPAAAQLFLSQRQAGTDQSAYQQFSTEVLGGGQQSPQTQPAPQQSPSMLSPAPMAQTPSIGQPQQQAAPAADGVPPLPASTRTMGPSPQKILEFINKNGSKLSPEARKMYMGLYEKSLEAYKPTTSQSDYRAYYEQEMAAGRAPLTIRQWEIEGKTALAPKTTINTGERADAEFSKKFAGANAERWGEYLKQSDVAKGRMSDIEIMREASRNLGSQGVAANVKATFGPYLEAAGIDVNGLSDIQTWEAVTKRIAPTLRVAGSGSTSNIEYEGMLKGLGPLSNNPVAREAILNTFEASSRNEIERGRIASLLATDQISRTEAEKMVQALPDPMTSFREWRKENPDAYAEALKQGKATTTEKPGDKKGEPAASGPPKNFDKMPVNDQLNWLQRNAPEGTEFTIKETGNKYRIENGKAVPVKKDNK
jgi:uncharacterized protein (TIGR02594 family)